MGMRLYPIEAKVQKVKGMLMTSSPQICETMKPTWKRSTATTLKELSDTRAIFSSIYRNFRILKNEDTHDRAASNATYRIEVIP